MLLPQTMGKWPLELVQTTVLHHPQPLPCHHGRQSSSTSAELSQYLPTSPRHSRQNSSCKSPPIPPRRPYIMTSPSSNPMTVAPPTLLKLSPNSIGKKTLSLSKSIFTFFFFLFVYLRFKHRRALLQLLHSATLTIFSVTRTRNSVNKNKKF